MPLQTKLSFMGKVEQLLARLSRNDGFDKQQRQTLSLKLSGPEGDCHTGLTRLSDSRTLLTYKRNTVIRNVRQLTILSVEELADMATRLGIPAVEPEWLGANMLLSGIPDLSLLPPSTRLQFPSGATIVVDMENYPCSQIAKVVDEHHPGSRFKVVEAAMHKRGVTAWVEREGDVSAGDNIKIITPPNRLYPHA